MNIKQEFIEPNEYTRPGIQLQRVTAIAIHYTGDPGATAQNERDYFNGPCISAKRYASCHYVIGLQGEVIQLIPENEYAYCTCQANAYSLSIETCHPDATGKFTEAGEQALVELAASLCKKYGLNPTGGGLIRHYDVTGKYCPLYYVNHPECWAAFKTAVSNCISGKPYILPCSGKVIGQTAQVIQNYCDTSSLTVCPGMDYTFKTGSEIKCANQSFSPVAHRIGPDGYHYTTFRAKEITAGVGFYIGDKRACIGAVVAPWTDTPPRFTKKFGETYQFKTNARIVSGSPQIFRQVGNPVVEGKYWLTKFQAVGRGECGFYMGALRTNVGTVV